MGPYAHACDRYVGLHSQVCICQFCRWGNTAITINASSFFSDTGPLSNLKSAGYQWQVWRPPNRRLNETEWVSVNPDGVRKHQPEDALRGTFNVVNTEVRMNEQSRHAYARAECRMQA